MTSDHSEAFSQVLADLTRPAAVRDWVEAQEKSGAPLFDYRYDHVVQVVTVATHLARAAGADLRVVVPAAWLHDIAKPGLGGADDHGRRSAEMAARLLKQQGLDDEDVARVCEAIRSHVGLTRDSPLDTLEAQVVWEADKIVKLGIVGLLHYVLNAIRLRPGMDMYAIAEELRRFIPLARRIASSMHTAEGQRLAQERLRHLEATVSALASELRPDE